ncbi:TPA: type IV secretion system immunity protein Tsi2 [Pseudomonas aeruginosa]
MNLKPQTLMVAIQCVAARTRELDAQLQNDDPQNAAELEQLLVGYDLAADDLKNAYEQALGQYSGLSPYDRLIEEPAS